MSVRQDFKGDYMGFSYGVTQPDGTETLTHSSTLGIVRTSDGSRFNENLLPTMQDKTVQVPGGDGTYYFGSYYTQRQFSVSFAFDDLTEEQIGEIRRVFGDKKIHDLIFDETPYKVWSAKVTGTATIKYIPFDEGSTHRLYKGEGSIQFTCYYPFARCYSRKIDDYYKHPAYGVKNEDGTYKSREELPVEQQEEIEKRIGEWISASGITEGDSQYLRNFGDKPVSFKITVDGEGWCQIGDNVIAWGELYNGSATLDTKTGLAIDSKGTIVNDKFTGNLFAKIPVGFEDKDDTISSDMRLSFTCEYI